MDSSFSTRTDALRLLLATALVIMCFSVLSTLTGLAAWPLLDFINNHLNWLVTLSAAVMNVLCVALVLLGLRAARSRAAASPASIWGQNARVLEIASFVTLVYLAEIVVGFVGGEARAFVEIRVGNATQIDMFTPTAHFWFAVVFPAIGVGLLLVFGPRLLRGGTGR